MASTSQVWFPMFYANFFLPFLIIRIFTNQHAMNTMVVRHNGECNIIHPNCFGARRHVPDKEFQMHRNIIMIPVLGKNVTKQLPLKIDAVCKKLVRFRITRRRNHCIRFSYATCGNCKQDIVFVAHFLAELCPWKIKHFEDHKSGVFVQQLIIMLAVNLLIAFYSTADGSGRSGRVFAYLLPRKNVGYSFLDCHGAGCGRRR